jgi:CRP-like cAMP-binding protein
MLLQGPVPKHNRLLARLPEKQRRLFIAACDEIQLSLEEVLAEAGKPLEYAYFPLDCFISQVAADEAMPLEIALVGNEGMFGAPLGLGVGISHVKAIVQGSGSALRMRAAEFRRQLDGSKELRKCVGAYTFVTLVQLGQTAACNRFHVVKQRLARWLLMSADRAHSPEFAMTHAFLAYMLGVRRVGVTVAAGHLQAEHLIRYSRGKLTVLDRKGLEEAACNCYRTDLATYQKAFA